MSKFIYSMSEATSEHNQKALEMTYEANHTLPQVYQCQQYWEELSNFYALEKKDCRADSSLNFRLHASGMKAPALISPTW